MLGFAQPETSRFPLDPEHQVRLEAGDLDVIIADNEAFGDHRAGYNGVAVLRHRLEPRSLFVPRVAGLNLEHIFDGERRPTAPEEFFEPRYAPMLLSRISDLSIALHQPPTPYHQLESRTTFTLTPPHFIDLTFECIPRADTYPRGYIGLFWASYINAPENLAIYTIGRGKSENRLRWIQHASGQHDDRSTLPPLSEARQPTFGDGHEPTLYTSLADQYYAYPFYYAHFGELVYLLMFERTEGLRFAMSPTGGGRNEDGTTNPAWDWQWIIFDPVIGRTYGYKARAVYKPWAGRDDVVAEYERWSGETVTMAAQ